MKDEIEEYDSDNDSSAGRFGESNRSSNNSAVWLDTKRGSGRNHHQKTYSKARKKSNTTKKKLRKMGMHEDDYGTDDEWRAADSMSSLGLASTKRQTRSSSKSRKAKKKDEVIEILDSSSEEESSEDEAMSPEGKQSKVSSYY